jgi:pyruvate/2-oxoglutarate dehydrogenase complex dihydrolipoamide acyltransferase (E2) component
VAQPIVMPSLGMFTAEGTLTAWLRPNGARVEVGEPVAEVTTEKTTQEVVAPAAGVVHRVAAEGTLLSVQGLMGYILAEGEAPPETPGSAPPRPAVAATAPGSTPIEAPRPAPAGEIRSTPIARRLAVEHGVDLATVRGTGPGGRIVEADILAAVAARSAAPPAAVAPPARRVRERIPLVGVRRTIAERLRGSQSTVASVTLTREVDADVLWSMRDRLSARLGVSVPFDALFVKILAQAARDFSALNSTIEGDAILVLEDVNVGFAVAAPNGLFVPVIRNADVRPLAEVGTAVRELSERVRSGGIRLEDMADGTITITNLGAYGVDAFSPIINPPQSAILGVGRIAERPVVRDGQLTVGRTSVLSLTFDHRVVDGAPAAQLLGRVAELMNDEGWLGGLG